MTTWLDGLEALALLALTVQVWRLTREVRRLARLATPRTAGAAPQRGRGLGQPSTGAQPSRGAPLAPGARPAGSFATLVTGYLELLSRTPAGNGTRAADGTPAAGGQAVVAVGEQGEPHPDTARVVELVRQGLGADEIARRLGMASGEVQVLERLARARGLL